MIQRLFLKLPFFVKQSVFYLISYKTYKERYSGLFTKYVEKFTRDNSTFSSNLMVKPTKNIHLLYGIDMPRNISDFEILNKQILKEKLSKVEYYSKIKYKEALFTSGTSGSALKIPISNNFLKYKFASIYAFKKLHNAGIDQKTGSFIGRVFLPLNAKRSPYWIKSKFTNQVLFSQYHLNSYSVQDYLVAIKKHKLISLHGYPSTLSNFADLIIKNDLVKQAHSLNLRNITLGSESLSAHQKQLIQDAFNCKVLNFYGQTESVVDIFECEKGHMHINEAFSYVELIANEDGYYRLIGTQLKNELFPLIRYDTGDLVTYDPNYRCSCGREYRVVQKILGRQEDSITLSDGRKIGRLDHIFKNSFNIVEAQFVQYKKGASLLYIVKGKNYNQTDEMNLFSNIKEKLGLSFKVEIHYVEEIEKTSNGKLKQVISHL